MACAKLQPVRNFLRLLNRLALGPLSKLQRFFAYFGHMGWFTFDLVSYRARSKEKIPYLRLQPCLFDKTGESSVDYFYFYQDTWAAGKIFAHKPRRHVDVGSTVLLVGILSEFTSVVSVDVRPLVVDMKNLESIHGSVTAMPFEDGSVESLSSICVLEHIGLGRYGDELDPEGTDKAIRDMKRVLAPGGNLYVSTQLGPENEVCFNAHRVFTLESFLDKFKGLKLIDSLFIQYEKKVSREDYATLDFSRDIVGCFHFRK